MLKQSNINEIAEQYLKGNISHAERQQIQKALAADADLKQQWEQTIEILQVFESNAAHSQFKQLVKAIGTEHTKHSSKGNVLAMPRSKSMYRHLRTVAIAASLVLGTSLLGLYVMDQKENKLEQKKFMLLRRELENLKSSQSKIIDSLNKTKDIIAVSEANYYGGTGFAIAPNGYLATNYHVVKDAANIYVQTKQGDKAAYIVARDANADIAILKIEDNNFSFVKGNLPYKIDKRQSGLGQKVFSIGYPKDEVVYNEGYISCESGFEGDVLSYQLEMVANPGQSGSPVLDSKGNVVALITGKQSNTSGTTYAVHSGALIDLVHSLPKAVDIKLTESNKINHLERTEQVKKIRDFVYSIKVN